MDKIRRNYKLPNREEKLRFMRALEANGMNKSQTARELNISRTTLHRYFNENWETYLKEKDKVNRGSEAIVAKQMLLSFDAENARIKLEDSCARAIDLMNERINTQSTEINSRELIQFISTLLPYLLDKKAIMGVKEAEETAPKRPSVVQAFLDNLNKAKDLKPV
ncbi:helix-turn-helix domain-containing protein [uncultured Draconibacterium sp.]|uniref:helix-turn-helix domain-containing protein n=1 Tax=uncultured Draconibacterium sp. TaxID=1573823 RepID=UPI0032618EA7